MSGVCLQVIWNPKILFRHKTFWIQNFVGWNLVGLKWIWDQKLCWTQDYFLAQFFETIILGTKISFHQKYLSNQHLFYTQTNVWYPNFDWAQNIVQLLSRVLHFKPIMSYINEILFWLIQQSWVILMETFRPIKGWLLFSYVIFFVYLLTHCSTTFQNNNSERGAISQPNQFYQLYIRALWIS